MAKYIGMTIGPIYDTMMLSSKPAALWGASYMFSYLGKKLCQRMQSVYQNNCQIIVPYADFEGMEDSDNPLSKMNEGVGLVHDRIIAVINSDETEKFIMDDIKSKVIEPVRKELIEQILNDINMSNQQAIDEMNEYFQIYAVCIELNEGAQIVPVISGALDILEMEKQYVTQSRNDYLAAFLENASLKESFFSVNLDKKAWQLINSKGNVKSIPDIAGAKKYYALVQADGDGMGKVLCGLTTPEQVKAFSEKCIRYSAKVSEIIGKHGGVTIYAGGDDLLFLAPVGKEDTNILSLIKKLRAVFAAEFYEEEYAQCNVSYGVQIVYEKFPLYEAFDMVSKLLFVDAKAKRNSCAVALQKHSGQSVEFVIHNFNDNPITDALIELIDAKSKGDFLKSAAKHFRNQIETVYVAIDKKCIDPLITNLFDNEMQKNYLKDIELVKNLLKLTLNDDITYHKEAKLAILALLRYADFYSEGGDI